MTTQDKAEVETHNRQGSRRSEEKMENENDSNLGELLLECRKDIRYYFDIFLCITFILISILIIYRFPKIGFMSSLFKDSLEINVFLVFCAVQLIYLSLKRLFELYKSKLIVYENALVVNKTKRIYFSKVVDFETFQRYKTKNARSFLRLRLENHPDECLELALWSDWKRLAELIGKQVSLRKET